MSSYKVGDCVLLESYGTSWSAKVVEGGVRPTIEFDGVVRPVDSLDMEGPQNSRTMKINFPESLTRRECMDSDKETSDEWVKMVTTMQKTKQNTAEIKRQTTLNNMYNKFNPLIGKPVKWTEDVYGGWRGEEVVGKRTKMGTLKSVNRNTRRGTVNIDGRVEKVDLLSLTTSGGRRHKLRSRKTRRCRV